MQLCVCGNCKRYDVFFCYPALNVKIPGFIAVKIDINYFLTLNPCQIHTSCKNSKPGPRNIGWREMPIWRALPTLLASHLKSLKMMPPCKLRVTLQSCIPVRAQNDLYFILCTYLKVDQLRFYIIQSKAIQNNRMYCINVYQNRKLPYGHISFGSGY